MQYLSTRGEAPELGFCDAVLTGLASDGGLYLPKEWPQLSQEEIAGLANRPYEEVAFEIISRFVDGEIPDDELRGMIDAAYATFRHPSVTPIRELEPGHFMLELFHGPTLAFKDVAMQFLSRVMDHILEKRDARATIVGATSGDTGSAAIEAFKGRARTDIFILFPEGRVSPVQQRQMTTVADENVHNLAVNGSFDDCQTAVKAMFANESFRSSLQLSGVNSINWGRIVAQIVYYFTSAVALGAPRRKVSFTVPTGNFGDIFAGYAASSMGLPIEKLIIATNANDILRRTFETGAYETGSVVRTVSPSMDIQVSSNFERLLYEASGRNPASVRRMMDQLRQSGRFEVPLETLSNMTEHFAADTATESETDAAIESVNARAHYLIDPHTAVGVHVARRKRDAATPMITLSTAHPAKFPAAVEASSGVTPALPDWMADLYEREERFEVLDNDQAAIEEFVRTHSRV